MDIEIENLEIAELKRKAENVDAKSQFQLGEMYYYGEGVEHNYKKAIEWFEKAADQGHRVNEDLDIVKKQLKMDLRMLKIT